MPAAIAGVVALLLLLLATASPAMAAIAFLRATAAQGTSATLDTTGATLVTVCTTHANAQATLSDSRGNTYAKAIPTLTINDSTTLWWSAVASVGAGTVFTLANGAGSDTIVPAAFSGVPGATVERSAGQIQSNIASGAAISSGLTATTITADQAVIGCSQLSTNTAFTWTATGGATLAASLGAANLASTGALSYKVVATPGTQAATFTANTAGSAATQVATFKAGVVDTQAPTTPTGVNATAVGSFENDLAWTPSSDNVGILFYNVRRCQGAACPPVTVVATPPTNSYQDTGRAANTLYRYTVQAVDPSSNLSGQSAIVEATTQAVTECNFAWTAPVGGTAPDLYTVRRCDTTASTCAPSVTLTTTTPPTTSVKDLACPQPVACFDVNASASGSGSAFTSVVCANAPAQTVPVLSASPPSLVFAATVNGSNPASQSLTITNGTASTMNWTVGDNGTILNLAESPSSGTNTTQVTVSVSIAGLSAGTTNDTIRVTAPGATNSPVDISVTLILSPATTPTVGRGGRVR